MGSYPLSTVRISNLVHSTSGALSKYQSHDSKMGINSYVPSNSFNPEHSWRNHSPNTNEQKQISTGYNGSASINLDVDPLLQLIADILKVESEGESKQTAFKFDSEKKTSTMIPGLSQLIHKITGEIWCDCPEKSNAHERANSLLNLLSNYSPDAKVVLVLTAFVIRYGDVIAIMNQYTNKSDSTSINNSLELLKILTGTLLSKSTLEHQIEVIKNTVNIVLGIVRYIRELKGFQSWNNILSEISINEIIFWMVTAVIHCGFTVTEFYSGYALSLEEKSELQFSSDKIKYYYNELTTQITFYRQREVEIQVASNYQEILGLLRFPPARNIDILCYFISSSIDGNILHNPGTNVPTTLRIFQGRNVLILYSSFESETLQEELSLLERLYKNSQTRFAYKIVWMPISDEKAVIDEKRYNAIISDMSFCYTLTYEAVQQVNCGLVHLLKKDWGFTGRPMLVVLDERGRMVRQNALLMLHLYGEEAFPFTADHEFQLLENKSRGMQLLFVEIDATLSQWIKSKEQYVCLFGGDDIKWCKSMAQLIMTLTKGTNIKVETAYVGRNSHHQDTVEAMLSFFREAKLGYSLKYSSSTLFWERLQKFVLHFSTHNSSNASEEFLSWALSLLTYDRSSESWVAIGNADRVLVFRGSIFANGVNEISLKSEQWRSEVTTVNFLQELSEWMEVHKTNQGKEKHCHKLEIAGSPHLIRGDMHCPTCNEAMQMTMLYKCCH